MEEKEVMGVVVVEDLVVGTEEVELVDLMLESEDFTVEIEEEGETLGLVEEREDKVRTLDLVLGSVEVGEVELLTGRDDEAEDNNEETITAVVATAVGTASTVTLSSVMPQQEQAEE